MSDIVFTNLEKVLAEYGFKVVDRYRGLLASSKTSGKVRTTTNATGTLSRLVHPDLQLEGDRYELWIDFGVEYWYWLEYGTRQQGPFKRPGKWPPRQPILDWIKAKPVIPYKGRDGRIPTQNQLVFLIRRKIGNEGTPALGFLGKSLDPPLEVYRMCQEAAMKDVENWIKEILYGS